MLKRGQKTVFGDAPETAWRLLVLGAVTTTNSGFGIDLPETLRAEMLAVADHFCHWAELTYAKVRQRSARDDDTAVYYALEGELAAYAMERRQEGRRKDVSHPDLGTADSWGMR